MKLWHWMPWSSFFKCWVLSQLFHSPLSPSSRVRLTKWLWSKSLQGINAGEGMKKRELWECKLVQPLWRTVWRFLKKLKIELPSVQFSSVSQSCPTLCNPMIRSTPGFPVHHQLPEFTQTHVHQVGDAIQPSQPLSSPSLPALNPSQHQSLFQW